MHRMCRSIAALLVLSFLPIAMFVPAAQAGTPAVNESAKPKAAFFPLGGEAVDKLREQVSFAFRQKLDRDGHYDVLDGYKMKDVAAEAKDPITFDTPADAIRELGKGVDATVLVWGDMDKANNLRVKILDLRDADAKPREMARAVKAPTDLRFVTEQILATLPNVTAFEHPTEVAVTNDAQARELWAKNPNLLAAGDFSDAARWHGILESQYYPPPVGDSLPAVDKVCIYRMPGDKETKPHNVLAMRLSKGVAESNGLACLSDPIAIQPNTRYRISYRYKSDGPTLHVFVKGYTTGENIKGEKAAREVYRRQVPPSGPTKGKWVTVVDDLNPQHVAFPVETLRVDLYAYLGEGVVMFDDVVVKAVGSQTHRAKDDAIAPPVRK